MRSLLGGSRCHRRSPAPNCIFFPLQLLDFAHTWSARGDNDIDLFDILRLAAVVHIFIKTDPGWALSATVSSPTFRTTYCNRRTPRQARTPQRPNVAHSVRYTCGIPHLGGPKVRACNSHACCLDRYLRTSPISWEEQQHSLPQHPHLPEVPPTELVGCAHLMFRPTP